MYRECLTGIPEIHTWTGQAFPAFAVIVGDLDIEEKTNTCLS